jgi:hypothetical protein
MRRLWLRPAGAVLRMSNHWYLAKSTCAPLTGILRLSARQQQRDALAAADAERDEAE